MPDSRPRPANRPLSARFRTARAAFLALVISRRENLSLVFSFGERIVAHLAVDLYMASPGLHPDDAELQLSTKIAELRSSGESGAAIGQVLHDLALVRLAKSDTKGSRSALTEALALAADSRAVLGNIYGALAVTAWREGDFAEARGFDEQSLQLRIDGKLVVAAPEPPAAAASAPGEAPRAAQAVDVGGEAQLANAQDNAAGQPEDFAQVFNAARLLLLRARQASECDVSGLLAEVKRLRAAVGKLPEQDNGARLVCDLLEDVVKVPRGISSGAAEAVAAAATSAVGHDEPTFHGQGKEGATSAAASPVPPSTLDNSAASSATAAVAVDRATSLLPNTPQGHQGYLERRSGPSGILRRRAWQRYWFVLVLAFPKSTRKGKPSSSSSSAAAPAAAPTTTPSSGGRWEVRWYTNREAWERDEKPRGYFTTRRIRTLRALNEHEGDSRFEIAVENKGRGKKAATLELRAADAWNCAVWTERLESLSSASSS